MFIIIAKCDFLLIFYYVTNVYYNMFTMFTMY